MMEIYELALHVVYIIMILVCGTPVYTFIMLGIIHTCTLSNSLFRNNKFFLAYNNSEHGHNKGILENNLRS